VKFKCTAWVGKDGWVLVDGADDTDAVEESDREKGDLPVTLEFEVPDVWFKARVVEAKAEEVEKE